MSNPTEEALEAARAGDVERLVAVLAQARADGGADFASLVHGTFETLSRDPSTAWQVLARVRDRAATGRHRAGKVHYERAVRELGTVVAWCDSRVTVQRSLSKPGAPKVRVLGSEKEVQALREELGVASYVWGRPPQPGEPADLAAHRQERVRMIAAGDAAGLARYCSRYEGVRLLRVDRDGRDLALEVVRPETILQETVHEGDHAALVSFALTLGPPVFNVAAAAHEAITRDRPDFLALLLPALTDIDATSMRDDTLLAHAVRERRASIVTTLLAAGAKPNLVSRGADFPPTPAWTDQDGNGPMVDAVRNSDAPILEQLLRAGGDPFAKTGSGQRVVDMARTLGDHAILQLLEASGGPAPAMDMRAACETGNVERVLELLAEKGPRDPIATSAQNGNTALLRAVIDASQPVDPALLAYALWFSSQNGHVANVELLLARGASPNGYVSSGFESARKTAVGHGHTQIAKLLAAAGGKLTKPKRA